MEARALEPADSGESFESPRLRPTPIEAPPPIEVRGADEPGVEIGRDGQAELHLTDRGAEFSRLRALDPLARPGTVVPPGLPVPWPDNPENAESWRFEYVDEAQRRHEEGYVREGLTNPSLARINPADGRPGRDTNCADVARATAMAIEGLPYAARPLAPDASGRLGENPRQMERWIGRQELDQHLAGRDEGRLDSIDLHRTDLAVEQGFDQLHSDLTAAGPGAHAVVLVGWKPDPGGTRVVDGSPAAADTVVRSRAAHWFNVANLDGEIVYLDAQPHPPVSAGADSPRAKIYRDRAMYMSWIRIDGGRR